MIARDWHGVVPSGKADEYLGLLIEVGLGDYRKTPGCCDSFVLRRVESDLIHFRLISFWESREAIRVYAGGGDINIPQYTAFDPNYLVELERVVLHHTVVPAASNPRKLPGDMIARTWHGAVPIDKSNTYLALLKIVSQQKHRAVPGNQGSYTLHRTAGDLTHFVMLTFWDSVDAIKGFAGENIEVPKCDDFDPTFLVAMEPTVQHHEVFQLN